MPTVLIIDDERIARLNVVKKLETHFPKLQIVGLADSADTGYDLIIQLQPDLVYLDIAMPNESGFDLLRRVPTKNFEVIFTTGFDEHAIEAIKFCAIGYVLKPMRKNEFIEATQNALKRIDTKLTNERILHLLNFIKPDKNSSKLGIPTDDGLEFIEANDIIRCEGSQRCTVIYSTNKNKIISSYNIGEYLRMLQPFGFVMVHKSHIINPKYLKKYRKDGTIILTDNSIIPVSKRKRNDFLDRLNRL